MFGCKRRRMCSFRKKTVNYVRQNPTMGSIWTVKSSVAVSFFSAVMCLSVSIFIWSSLGVLIFCNAMVLEVPSCFVCFIFDLMAIDLVSCSTCEADCRLLWPWPLTGHAYTNAPVAVHADPWFIHLCTWIRTHFLYKSCVDQLLVLIWRVLVLLWFSGLDKTNRIRKYCLLVRYCWVN